MSKSKTSKQAKQQPRLQRFYFPTLGRTVEASSQDEALRCVKKDESKGEAQEVGDGNI